MARWSCFGAIAAWATLTAAQTITLQAESATLSGVAVASEVAGYTGMISRRLKDNRLTRYLRDWLCGRF